MTTLRLRAASGESLIKIGTNIIPSLQLVLKGCAKVLIVTDNNVAALYRKLAQEIKESNPEIQFHSYNLPEGEGAKTLDTHAKIVASLAELAFCRSDAILSIGGGVVSDIAGFCAATYMRGLGYISMPTTLLAMVDAAIGGKCGVNLKKGKNLVGCFYHPQTVIVNPAFLDTLPEREFNCGIAEIIKYAVIADSSIFKLLNDTKTNINKLIHKSIAIKKAIVETDERESRERMKLNFGHTFGHIAEKAGGYKRFSHGEAVAYGMRMEAKLLKLAGLANDKGIIAKYLDKFGLTAMPNLNKQIIAESLLLDKKMRGENLYFAGFSKIGKGEVYKFSTQQMLNYLDLLFKEGENGDIVK